MIDESIFENDKPYKFPGDRIEIKLDGMVSTISRAVDETLEGRKKMLHALIKERFERLDLENELRQVVDEGIRSGLEEIKRDMESVVSDRIKQEVKNKVREVLWNCIDVRSEDMAGAVISNISVEEKNDE